MFLLLLISGIANMIAEYFSLIAAIMRGYRYIPAQKDVSTWLTCAYRRMGHDWHVCQFEYFMQLHTTDRKAGVGADAVTPGANGGGDLSSCGPPGYFW